MGLAIGRGMKIIPVNGHDRRWTRHRYILSFGAYGSTRLMVWANHLEDALDEAIDWIADNAPGLLCDDEVSEEYERAIKEGLSEEEAHERATEDTTCGGNAGHYILSYEWSIVAEDPTRADILAMQKGG